MTTAIATPNAVAEIEQADLDVLGQALAKLAMSWWSENGSALADEARAAEQEVRHAGGTTSTT